MKGARQKQKCRSRDRPFQRLGAGVELERGPVKGSAVVFLRVNELEFCVAQSDYGVVTIIQTFVKLIHQLRRRSIADFPQAADYVMGASAQESPSESDEAFSRVHFHTGAVASGNGYEIGGERAPNNVARVELEGIAVGRKNDGGFERLEAAGRSVRRKVNVRELARIAGKIGGGCGCGFGEECDSRFRKVFLEDFGLSAGIRENGKIFAGKKRVTKKNKIGSFGRSFAVCTREQGERIGD